MSKKNDGMLKPLAKVKDDATLATTEGQDRYFLVFANGSRKLLTLQQAVIHYLRAFNEQDDCFLVWNRKEEGVTKRRTKERKFAEEASRWEEEARRLMENLSPIDGK